SLESARQAANKYAEKKLFQNFYLQVVPYPHLVVRESASLGVAGADRISKGMKRAFGRPKGRMALLHKGDAVLRARIMKKDLSILKEAFRRARLKMSGDFTLTIRDITADSINMARKEHVFKKKEEEKPKEEAAPAAAATPAEGETPAKEEKEEKKK
ncbi:MAG: 50S ribosomal protein L16, partial [Candidatus Micrarchaeota archaeon]